MKQTLLTIIFISFSVFSYSQEINSSLQKKQQNSTLLDSLSLFIIDNIKDNINSLNPRYKIYKTTNNYNLIKLDTATGRLWQVQYRMNDIDGMVVPINDDSLLIGNEAILKGRFELYPTNNNYTFILLDTIIGYTYQVQWNTDPEKRFREPLF